MDKKDKINNEIKNDELEEVNGGCPPRSPKKPTSVPGTSDDEKDEKKPRIFF